MKTLFLFLSIFLIVSFETAFAVCKIDKKAAPVIEKYRITLQEEIAAIQSEITSKSC
jgi:hypothetical protein